MSNRKLIEITLNYPYDRGETFCEDELRIAENEFDEIILISLSGHKLNTNRYIPPNARLISARTKRFQPIQLIKSVFYMFSFKIINEYIFATKQLRFGNQKRMIIKELFVNTYYMFVLEKIFKHEKFDYNCIFYSYWLSYPAYFLALWKKKYPDIKAISRTHRFDCFIERGYQPFRREILENLDAIYSISKAGKDSLSKRLIPFTNLKTNQKIKVAHLGIKKINNHMNPSKDLQKDKTLCLVTCSYISSIKRLDMLIDALSILDFQISWIHFGDGELLQVIDKYAKEKLEHKDNIQYALNGWTQKSDILEFYETRHIDIFINCSDNEGIPVSIMEAMAYGIPTIARNTGGNKEIVDETNGVLLPEQCNFIELANAIKKIQEAPYEEYETLRLGAFKKYHEEYRAEHNYKAFFEDIKNL